MGAILRAMNDNFYFLVVHLRVLVDMKIVVIDTYLLAQSSLFSKCWSNKAMNKK